MIELIDRDFSSHRDTAADKAESGNAELGLGTERAPHPLLHSTWYLRSTEGLTEATVRQPFFV